MFYIGRHVRPEAVRVFDKDYYTLHKGPEKGRTCDDSAVAAQEGIIYLRTIKEGIDEEQQSKP